MYVFSFLFKACMINSRRLEVGKISSWRLSTTPPSWYTTTEPSLKTDPLPWKRRQVFLCSSLCRSQSSVPMTSSGSTRCTTAKCERNAFCILKNKFLVLFFKSLPSVSFMRYQMLLNAISPSSRVYDNNIRLITITAGK